jgi:hypothetical protein
MTVPFTIAGQDIPVDAPGAMVDAQTAAQIQAAAETYRQAVMHCHLDVVGRDVTVNATNVPDGLVGFTFGDGTADTEQNITAGDGQASATHTYDADGTYDVGVYTATDRWHTEAAVNWPPPPPEVPAP